MQLDQTGAATIKCGSLSASTRWQEVAFVLLLVILFAPSAVPWENARVRKHHESSFDLIGLEIRTNNKREASSEGLIGKQWRNLYGEGLLAKIPHRLDEAVLALYTEYASDEHGDYTYILGARVTSCTEVPEGMVCRRVPAADYVTLESELGPIPEIVVKLWQKVWSATPAELGGSRSYRSDYELYGSRSADQKHAVVELHLGVL